MSDHRVLVVEDHESFRAMLVEALEVQFEVVEAAKAQDALQRLDAYEPDIALLDVAMPVMDGFELCRRIRGHAQLGRIPIVFLSAHATEEKIRNGFAVGANLFLAKPIDPARLLKNLGLTLDRENVPISKKRYPLDELRKMEESSDWQGRLFAQSSFAPMVEDFGGRDGRQRTRRHRTAPRATLLPRHAPDDAPRKSVAAGVAAPRSAKSRIMIVEHEAEDRRLIRRSLRGQYEVLTVRDGLEALEKMDTCQPDLIVLDLAIPKIGAFQILSALQRSAAHRAVPVLAIISRSNEAWRPRAEKLGASGFIRKPCVSEELLAEIHRIVSAPDYQVSPKRESIREIFERTFLAMKDKSSDGDLEYLREKNAEFGEVLKMEARERRRAYTKAS